MINDLLTKLGFSDKEIQVYLTVLENGKILPAAISSLTNIKRPTVYSIGKELVKRGVITEDIKGAGGYFVALPPERLNTAIENEEKLISEKKKTIKEVIEELDNIPKSKSYSVPKMRFIDEFNVNDFLYKQTPIWDQSMIKSGNPTWWGFMDKTFLLPKERQEWIDWYWKQTPKEIDLKLISNDSDVEKGIRENKNYTRRHLKFWNKDFDFTGSTWIIGDYVVFFMSRNRPNYIVEINDAVYAENMRQVFKNLWNIVNVAF